MTKPQPVEVTPADTAAPGDIEMELEAMHVVGDVIGGLRDHDARLRILNWAIERFHPDFAKALNGASMPETASADLDLFADNLDGLFENAAPVVKVDPGSMDNLDGLFENDAPVVNIAARPVENLDGLFEIDAPVVKVDPRSMENVDVLLEVDAPVVKVAPGSTGNVVRLFEIDAPVGNIGPQSGQPQPELGSLFRDFIAEFQQLASEMQGG